MRTCLWVGGVCTSGMGAYHFFLPTMFRWSEYVQGAPQPIWAIFAMNVMLSFLMLWGGLTTIFDINESARGLPQAGVRGTLAA